MFRSLANIALKKIIKRLDPSRPKQFMDWENIQRIALLINKNDLVDKRSIDRFIDESKKHVEVFFIESRAKEATYHDWHCFSKKDRNFLGLPNKQAFFKIKALHFDVSINTCGDENLFSEALHAGINAPYKCGTHAKNHISDLVILKKGSDNLINYLNEVQRYLKMIRTKKQTQ